MLTLKKDKNKMKKTNESGRSMVEMLGVLAIIGVLSIGGIAGYTLAMNRYRANEILNAAALVAIAATSAEGGSGATRDLSELGGVEAITLPAIDKDEDITGYANGHVTINVNKDYLKVAELVYTLSGNRVENTAKPTGTGPYTINVNMSASVKKSS
ncbi:MAG: hypothetical protein IKS41_00065 [Alphaproteobacteria bacterium]|nr:hypothetical protein [Alphaproteobacteria bacterium]